MRISPQNHLSITICSRPSDFFRRRLRIKNEKTAFVSNFLDLLGSTIHSDECKAYAALRNNPDYTYTSINHSKLFVDPLTGVHTQNIENIWMRVKRKQKKQGGICRWVILPASSSFSSDYLEI